MIFDSFYKNILLTNQPLDSNLSLNFPTIVWMENTKWSYNIANIVIWATILVITILVFLLIRTQKDSKFKVQAICLLSFILFCTTIQLDFSMTIVDPIKFVCVTMLGNAVIATWIFVLVLHKYNAKFIKFKTATEHDTFLQKHNQELTNANNQLAESEQQLSALVNNNPDIISRIGSDMKYKFMNESISNMYQSNIEDIVGKTVMEVTGSSEDSNNNEFIRHLQQAFTTGQMQKIEFSAPTNSTMESYFSLSIIPLKNEINGKTDNVLTVTKDITQQIINEKLLKNSVSNLEIIAESLEKKCKILEDFTFIVSHNLRSPVGNLSALFHLIEIEQSASKKEKLFSMLKESFTILSSTVADLTNVVQIRQNTEIPKELLKFEDMLNNNLKNLDSQIITSQAEITYNFKNKESIQYPKIYLESIFLNLLTNSIKYRSEERKLKINFVSTIDKNGIFTLTCEDNGLGIDLKKHGSKIFGMNKTFHCHPDARGVGLFITKNQIETMGGHIYVSSEVDKGTIFTIVF